MMAFQNFYDRANEPILTQLRNMLQLQSEFALQLEHDYLFPKPELRGLFETFFSEAARLRLLTLALGAYQSAQLCAQPLNLRQFLFDPFE